MLSWKKGRERFASTTSIAANKGLLNEPGENNCFMNSAIQVLWHLDVFRRSFRLLNGHACMGPSCIFCALKDIFQQFQHSKDQALPPNALRSALAETFQQQNRFQLGLMDDAAECFENILLRMHVHIGNTVKEDVCTASHCIPHQKFGLSLVEQCVCVCGATSEPLPFIEMVHYVSATALCAEDEEMRHRYGTSMNAQMFGRLIRIAGSWGDERSCPSECGARVDIRKVLMNCPDVVSVGIVWDSEEPQVQHIIDLVHALGTTLRLSDLFHTVVDERASRMELYLVGMVCYYGKHYSTFFFHTKLRKWVYFDDAQVSEVGKRWSNVITKCIKGHHQPLLLLYANPHADPVSAETAPKSTTMLPGYHMQNGAADKFGRPLLGDVPEMDSLSSEGDTASYLDEESSGTESMQAASSAYSPPPPSKSKSKSRVTAASGSHSRSATPEKQHAKSKSSHHNSKHADTKSAKNKPESVVSGPSSKQKSNVLERSVALQPPRDKTAREAPVAKVVEQPRRPVFQWNMATEKASSSNVKVGHYVEPSPAQWTKYKPYPQTQKAPKTKSQIVAVTKTAPNRSVQVMDSQGSTAFRLTSQHPNGYTSSEASNTPPQTRQHFVPQSSDLEGLDRNSPVSLQRRRSSQTSTSTVGTSSLASSYAPSVSSRVKSPSPVSTSHVTLSASDSEQESIEPPRTNLTAVDGMAHDACKAAARANKSHQRCGDKKGKPPLPPKPPCLSKPLSPTITPSPAPRLSRVQGKPSVSSQSQAYTPSPDNPLRSGPSQPDPSSPTSPVSPPALSPMSHPLPTVQQLAYYLRGALPDSHFLHAAAAAMSNQLSQSANSTRNSESSEKASSLLRDANDLIEQSRAADSLFDYSSALQLCLEATKMIEMVMLLPDVANEHMVKARLWHGQCISRARVLQRRKNIRQQSRGQATGGNRSSLTEADRHMVAPTNHASAASVPQPMALSPPSVRDMEEDESVNNLINFDKSAVTDLQHQVTKLYAQQHHLRQHPNYRPPIGMRPPASNSNNNSNNNNVRPAASQAAPSVAEAKDDSGDSHDRTKIFVFKRPENGNEITTGVLPGAPSNARAPASGKVLQSSKPTLGNEPMDPYRRLDSEPGAARPVLSSVDDEIAENMKSMSLETTANQQRFRSKTPTPQTSTAITPVSRHRRSKTPTPMSNKALLRARGAARPPPGGVAKPVPSNNPSIVSPTDDSSSTGGPVAPPRRKSNKSGSDVESPTTTSPTGPALSPMAAPVPGWPNTGNPMLPVPFNPAMFPPSYYPYMYEMWRFYASLSPEQREMFATMPINSQPLAPHQQQPVFPFQSPMTAPPALRAAYVENLKSQLGRNLKNFTGSVGQIPAQARTNNTNIYQTSKPKPIGKSEQALSQTGSDLSSSRSTKPPTRKAPVEQRPDPKYGRPRTQQGPSPSSPNRSRGTVDSRAPIVDKKHVLNVHRTQPVPNSAPVHEASSQGMLKWAEETKKHPPASGIPDEYKNRLIQDFANRSRREKEQADTRPTSASRQNSRETPVQQAGGKAQNVQGSSSTHGCELCGLTQVQSAVKYCASCKAYLSRFKPTVNSTRTSDRS